MNNETTLAPASMPSVNPLPVAIDNVHGFLDHNGTIWLKLHDVAIGLGFCRSNIVNGKVYNQIRWARVRAYLADINFGPLVVQNPNAASIPNFTTMSNQQLKEAFVPEFIFYILAMKANNDVARAFQLKVAVEIIPAIRRKGFYQVPSAEPTNQITLLNSAIDSLGTLANKLESIFGVQRGLALSKATALVEGVFNIELDIKTLIPHADHDVGLLTPTQIGERIGISNREVNRILNDIGLQTKVDKCWLITDAGKQFGEMVPFTRHGHTGYRPLWKLTIVDTIVDFMHKE